MPKFRSKPVEIDAWPVSSLLPAFSKSWDALPPEVADAYEAGTLRGITDTGFTVATLEGNMSAGADDWLIRGTEGEFYPCKSSVFARKYEPADGLARRRAGPDDRRCARRLRRDDADRCRHHERNHDMAGVRAQYVRRCA